VTDWAYHGVTTAIADFSPSEWAPGEHPDGVETFPAPDTFRSPHADADAARAAMAAALERLRARGRRPAALFLDGFFTADGIFTPEPEIVAALAGAARETGALYIADEVQSGHGRSGDGLWRFPAWGVHPDVVTLGKPMGNGHPIAAVVTRSDLVDRMAERTTFFSTFGGNPVACAAALAVLDVIDEEDLVARAAAGGEQLRAALRDLAGRHRAIADVRGRGFMTGVELVEPAGGAPATDLARGIRDDLREHGVLIGTTRREKNVVKIRPPLCITAEEVALIVSRLDEALATS
jgi:4-aminobutyrate aminotransferase-like enzyme